MPARGDVLTMATRTVTLTADMRRSPSRDASGSVCPPSIRDSGGNGSDHPLAYFRTFLHHQREEGKGTGLGLATVYGIVKQSPGLLSSLTATWRRRHVRHVFSVGSGSILAAAPATPSRPHCGHETILLVEDQTAVRMLLTQTPLGLWIHVDRGLQRAGGLRLVAAAKTPIHILLTDVVMPQMTGPALAERLRQQWPSLRVLSLCRDMRRRVCCRRSWQNREPASFKNRFYRRSSPKNFANYSIPASSHSVVTRVRERHARESPGQDRLEIFDGWNRAGRNRRGLRAGLRAMKDPADAELFCRRETLLVIINIQRP